jgi:hypothetical protein
LFTKNWLFYVQILGLVQSAGHGKGFVEFIQSSAERLSMTNQQQDSIPLHGYLSNIHLLPD